jgi:hypothetical protein
MLEQLEIFYGETNEARSSVYARLSVGGDTTGLSLSGRVTGPECLYSRTLTSTIPLRDLGPGPALLAEAVVPDPCFWSPEMPSLYEVFVELWRDGQVIETVNRQLGIRMFGRRGRNLFFNGRRWVCRGVYRSKGVANDLSVWRDMATAMIEPHPSDALCEASSRQGVFLVPVISGSPEEIRREVRRIARWPSVGLAIIDAGGLDTNELLRSALNVVLAQCSSTGERVELEGWANAVVGYVEDPETFARQFAECRLPVLGGRRNDEATTLADARRECDRLQRELAPFGDFAGYIIA